MNDNHPAETKETLVGHLTELRSTLLKSVTAILVIFIALAWFANDLYSLISAPLRDYLPEQSVMIATDVASPFLTPFKLAFVLSVFIAMPYLLYQLWQFIAPGLYEHEKKLAYPLFATSIVLFYAGMAFAYFVVSPLVFQFFIAIAPDDIQVMTDISRYLDFILKLLLAFGLAFEIPIATFLLVWSGLTTTDSLVDKRPFIIVGCFTLGMLLTPPDVISQILLGIPMWALFECGLFMAKWWLPKLNRNHEQLNAPHE